MSVAVLFVFLISLTVLERKLSRLRIEVRRGFWPPSSWYFVQIVNRAHKSGSLLLQFLSVTLLVSFCFLLATLPSAVAGLMNAFRH
jgi:hypothetical protein